MNLYAQEPSLLGNRQLEQQAFEVPTQNGDGDRIESAMVSQAAPQTDNTTTTCHLKKKTGRHGARNQHRHKHFCKWLLQQYSFLQAGDLVVDVAGGKGELAARLAFCHQIHVVLVDPRPADIVRTFETNVLPRLPKRHQERLQLKCRDDPSFLQRIVDERVTQLTMCLTDETLSSSTELREALASCRLIVGMHADGATECIVHAGLTYQKPFIVVPCCVFPNLFAQRTITVVDDDDDQQQRTIQVRTHDQFCDYLERMDERFERVVLPFEGRNVGILWRGPE